MEGKDPNKLSVGQSTIFSNVNNRPLKGSTRSRKKSVKVIRGMRTRRIKRNPMTLEKETSRSFDLIESDNLYT